MFLGGMQEGRRGFVVDEFDHGFDTGCLRCGDAVIERGLANFGQRLEVFPELFAHVRSGRFGRVDEHQRISEQSREVDGVAQGALGTGRVVVAQDDAHAPSSVRSAGSSPAASAGSTTLGFSSQNVLFVNRQKIMNSTPIRKIPTPITNGGPTPNQATPV